MSRLALCQSGCSLLEMRRFRPADRVVRRAQRTRGRRRRGTGASSLARGRIGGEPCGIIYIRFRIGIRHRAIAPISTGIAEQEDAASRLSGVIAVAHQQQAMPVIYRIGPAHLQHALFPLRLLRPTKTAAHGPTSAECALDLSKLRLGKAGFHIPFLDPMQTQIERAQSVCISQNVRSRGERGIELRLVWQVLFGTHAVRLKTLPQVGKETAVLLLGNGPVTRPVQKLDAEPRRITLLSSDSELDRARHGEH